MAITVCKEVKEDLDSIQIGKKLQENKKVVGRRERER